MYVHDQSFIGENCTLSIDQHFLTTVLDCHRYDSKLYKNLIKISTTKNINDFEV